MKIKTLSAAVAALWAFAGMAFAAPESVTVTWTADEKLAAWEDSALALQIETPSYTGIPGSKIYFSLVPGMGYEESYEITGTGIVYEEETHAYVYALPDADATLDVAVTPKPPAPTAITVAKTVVGGDSKGIVTLPSGVIMSETDTNVQIAASPGYRIGQVVVSGEAVPGLFGEAFTNVTVRFTQANPSISATFVKENAWFLEPSVRSVFFLTGNTYNPSYMAMTEDESDLFAGITRTQGDGCNRGIFQFNTAKAADTLDPSFRPVNATTKPLNTQYETQGSVFASKAAGVVIAGANYGNKSDFRDRCIAYPLGGEWGDSAYGATRDDRTVLMTDIPLPWQRLAPATFNGDGTRVYGNAYYNKNIYEFNVMKSDSGAVTNLLVTGRMWILDASRATAMAYALVGGSKNVYIANQGKIYMFREKDPFVRTEETEWVTETLELVGNIDFTATQLYVTGKADGTPRLVAGSATEVGIWDLTEDGTALRSETPVVRHALGDYTPSSNNRGLAILDDDTRAFVNHISGHNEMSVTVLEKKPENVTVRATFGLEEDAMEDVSVPRGGAFANVYSAPKDKYIKEVRVNGAMDAGFTPESYSFSGENLESHTYIAMTLDDIKYSVSWLGSENVTVMHGDAALSGTGGSFKVGDSLVFKANDGYAITAATVGGESLAAQGSEYTYIVGSGDGQSVIVVAAKAPPAYVDPEGAEITDEALISWLEGKGASGDEIASLGTRAKLMEKYLLNLDLTGSRHELKVGAIRAAEGEVEITVALSRENATGPVSSPINGRLRLYGADSLATGQFADEGVTEIANGDFSLGTEAVKRFRSTKKFFKAVIE